MKNKRSILLLILLTGLSLSLSATAQSQDLYWGGFVEGLWGAGFDEKNPTGRDYPVAETRLQLRVESFSDVAEAFGKLDFIQDGFDSTIYDIELREAYIKFRLPVGIDLKIGRGGIYEAALALAKAVASRIRVVAVVDPAHIPRDGIFAKLAGLAGALVAVFTDEAAALAWLERTRKRPARPAESDAAGEE